MKSYIIECDCRWPEIQYEDGLHGHALWCDVSLANDMRTGVQDWLYVLALFNGKYTHIGIDIAPNDARSAAGASIEVSVAPGVSVGITCVVKGGEGA